MPDDDDEVGNVDLNERNYAQYLAMQQPYADKATAQAEIKAFLKAARELRLKHKIPDVSVVVSYSFRKGEKDVQRSMMHYHMGAETEAPFMLGQAFQSSRERLTSILDQAHGRISD